MREGDVVVAEVPQADDQRKKRPALILREIVRPGFLIVLPRKSVLGSIGSIAPERHRRLLRTLSNHLVANLQD